MLAKYFHPLSPTHTGYSHFQISIVLRVLYLIEDQNLKLIKSFVESFSVVNEKFESNKYYGIFEINFNKNKILSFLRNKNIFHSRMIEKKVLFIPIFINLDLGAHIQAP